MPNFSLNLAIRILFRIRSISEGVGGFTGIVGSNEHFGSSLASLGDLDGTGPSVLALAVGEELDPGSPPSFPFPGAVWILFLNMDGTVMTHQKISTTLGGSSFGGRFGTSVASLGDFDGDGVTDLAVGAPFDNDGGPERGAVWILLMNADGTVKSHQKISDTVGGFTGSLETVEDLEMGV